MANNLIRQNQGTIITWDDAGTTHAFTLANLGAGAGRQGVEHDFGVGVVVGRMGWIAGVQFETTAVVGETVDIYLKTAPDGDHYDNDDGDGTDIAVSAEDKLNNLHYLGSIVVDEAAVVRMQISGEIDIRAEKVAPVFWNATADNLITPATTENYFILYEIPLEIE